MAGKAAALRNRREVWGIGVGDKVDLKELNTITGNRSRVLNIDNYKELRKIEKVHDIEFHSFFEKKIYTGCEHGCRGAPSSIYTNFSKKYTLSKKLYCFYFLHHS